MGIRTIISVSKIKKIIETKKNRNENIFREGRFSSPDSNVEGFSFLKLKFKGRINEIIININEIKIMINIKKLIVLYKPINWKLIIHIY